MGEIGDAMDNYYDNQLDELLEGENRELIEQEKRLIKGNKNG